MRARILFEPLPRALLLLVCAMALVGGGASAACPGRLQGSFLQLTDSQAQRPRADWSQLISQMRNIGIDNLFLQWTVVDRKSYFPAPGFQTPANTPLPDILRLAAQSGMRVWVGLQLDTHYWDQIKQNPDLLHSYFERRLRALSGFLGGLDATIGTAPFAGWYITDEIDDKTWLDPVKRAVLTRYLTQTVALLRQRRAGSKVAISGFSDSFADPALLAEFWSNLIRATGINLLLFQDGVGEGKVAIEDIALYYRPLDQAVLQAGARLGAVIELFSLMPDGQRVPAMISRIREQMAVADRFTSFPLVAFSVPDYMSRLAGGQASRLLTNYVSAQKGCRS